MKIAILGAGLMGRVLAYTLYRAGYSELTLIDKDNLEGSKSPAYIAAGMLAPYSESIMGGNLIYRLGKTSVGLWQSILKQLDASHLYNGAGTLLLAPSWFNPELGHYLNKIIFNTGNTNFYTRLSALELAALEPGLKFNTAYWLTEEASLNAREVFRLFGNYLVSRTDWRKNINIHQHDLQSLSSLGISNHFDWIIDCRGMGSKNWISGLRAVRGEIIRVYAPEVPIARPVRLFHPRHNIYISPYAVKHYVIGATEIEAEDYTPVSVRSSLDLMNYACMVHSGFAEARIIELGSNCRPTLTNNLPQITLAGNSIAINGLYRHGYLLAPALAEIVTYYLIDGVKSCPEIWS